MKRTAFEWFDDDLERGVSYITLSWRFEEDEARIKKITEQEYVDKYVHPKWRWKVKEIKK
jgi:hypothetical protein